MSSLGNPINIVFNITPRIVPAGKPSRIHVQPLFDHVRFSDGQVIQAQLIPVEGVDGQMGWVEPAKQAVEVRNGMLELECAFEKEQEYLLVLETPAQRAFEFRLYALEEDLYRCLPWKGDFHMHTHRSDGVEAPAYAPGACRQIGLDFMAVTDHGQYQPSLEAIQAFADVNVDLRIFPGEEVHPPNVQVHIVNFGGSFSVNALFQTPRYRQEVEEIAARLEDFPQGVDRSPYAACAWVFEQIRAGGGLGIFCHPYWFSRQRQDVPMALSDLIFERQPYGALELIGGYHRNEAESNALQVARYHAETAKGRHIPVVGVSDSHGFETGELFGWYYTIAFAPTNSLAELVGAIEAGYSVAVEALPGETARAFGSFRLVRYAQFLLREIFPAHDELCREEGRLMLAHAGGDPAAKDLLSRLKGRVAHYYAQVWGK